MNNQKGFLHKHPDFKSLIEITAQDEKIKDPYLVEKDYWLMHAIWSLQQTELEFQLKGGTSLSKGYSLIHRFSEDIDIRIEPNEKLCGFKVFSGKNHDDTKHRESRRNFFNWIAEYLEKALPDLKVKRDNSCDDTIKYRNGGIQLYYGSHFPVPAGIKDGILLEVGFDRTAPNQPRLITSWIYEKGTQKNNIHPTDNRAKNILCYEPKFTFVEKLQAVIRKFRLYKQGAKGASLPANFIRHYYDLFQLIDCKEVQDFIGTPEYEAFKKERFGSDDTKVGNSDALRLTSPNDRSLFENEYSRSESLYFKGRPTLEQILTRMAKDLHRL